MLDTLYVYICATLRSKCALLYAATACCVQALFEWLQKPDKGLIAEALLIKEPEKYSPTSACSYCMLHARLPPPLSSTTVLRRRRAMHPRYLKNEGRTASRYTPRDRLETLRLETSAPEARGGGGG